MIKLNEKPGETHMVSFFAGRGAIAGSAFRHTRHAAKRLTRVHWFSLNVEMVD
jgi:hypothetical protein